MTPASGIGSLRADGHRRAIHPADVRGRFTTARQLTFGVLIAIYIAVPFWTIGGQRALLFDIAHRQFFLFGWRGNAQDLWLTVFVLLGIGFSLIFATALLGRAWCGWACPQTVFLEGIFRRVERWLLGSHEARQKRAWTIGRMVRTGAAHLLYAAISVGLAHVFVQYFTIGWSFLALPIGAALYGNFAWFREQTCVVVCPYGRLQGVLIDDDSLVIGYDATRGEPRGKMRSGGGDCVDCKRCVAVCPTGIDIRDGLQLDCIACTACVDACDEIMVKIGRPRGLVRYDSLRGLRGEPRRLVRPRIIASAAALLLLAVGAVVAATHRTDFEANVIRMTGAPYVIENGNIRNQFEIHVVNKRAERAAFALRASAPVGVAIVIAQPEVMLEPFADRHVPIVATADRSTFVAPFNLEVVIVVEGDQRTLSVPFLGPAVPK